MSGFEKFGSNTASTETLIPSVTATNIDSKYKQSSAVLTCINSLWRQHCWGAICEAG